MAKIRKEIRIKGVPDSVHEDLKNIARNEGTTMSDMLKPKLREIANSYPPELRKPPLKD